MLKTMTTSGWKIAEYEDLSRLEAFLQTSVRPSQDEVGETLLHKAGTIKSNRQQVDYSFVVSIIDG